jgi:predicted RNase H-like nuclease (RuvC/YqgF family)
MSLIDIGQVLAENNTLKSTILELEKLIAQVRDERDAAQRRLYNAEWKLAEAEKELECIEELEEYMRLDGRIVDPLKGNIKTQVKCINQREAAELAIE